jgi:hypothetical protein
MATNKRIQVNELDFDNIKANLKNFMKGQSQFSDYDFEGSSLSVLMDLLAYNTHYNGIYSNLAVNEMFLDSASKRSSVVSLAKMLGYTPRSAKCATAVVDARIIAPSSSPDVVTIAAYQPFTTSVDNVSYTFYNTEAKTVTKSPDNSYTFTGLTLIEGTPLEYKYTVTDGIRYIIPNANVDIDTLSVKVQENSSSVVFDTYVRSDNITTAGPLTKVYWIKEIDNGLYELTFGNGSVGNALSSGNVVTINYHVSNLEAPNFASVFTYNGSAMLGSNLSVTTTTPAYGGASPEDISSIKFNAPKHYAAQDRCVTPDDYKTTILSKFPEAQTIQVWGGENNNPPIYGKTFICIKPKDATKLTTQQKEVITAEILAPRNIVSITPEIVDPEYFNIKVTTFVHYNPRTTNKSPSEIETIVKNAIMQYDADELQRFDGVLRYSKLVKAIDNADESITNNITRLMVHHPHSPYYGVSKQYLLDMINPISQDGGKQGAVFSTTGFYIPNSSEIHYMDDDAKGNIRLYYLDSNLEKVVVNDAIGSVDYELGRITIRNLNITALDGPIFDWSVKPESYDIVSALNQIVMIDPTLMVVKAIPDNTINGDLQAGYNYTFNSIRS